MPVRRQNNLARLLAEAGMSVEDLAEMTGASVVHTRKVLQGTAACSKRFKRACAMALCEDVDIIWPPLWHPAGQRSSVGGEAP
jgi:hypothetical protein